MIPQPQTSPHLRAFSVTALLVLLLTPLTTASLTAWWTDLGSQLLLQNTTTTHLTYSLCTSNSTPILPNDPPLTLDTTSFPPRNNTALAGRGWYDGSTTWASIFYQSTTGALINAVYACNPSTGTFSARSSKAISTTSLEGVKDAKPHSDTGLAAVLLGAREGYRVFYHDERRRVHLLTYADGVNRGEWAYGGVVTGADVTVGRALVAQFSSTRNTSLVYVKDGENAGVSRFNEKGLWYSSTFPRPLNATFAESSNSTALDAAAIPREVNTSATVDFSLPHFDGKARGLGISIDKAFTRNIFYIGSDRRLYQAANINYQWRMMNNQTESVWPAADEPGAEIAVTSEFESSIVRIYYESGGKLVEAKFDTDGIWKPAVPVPATNTTMPAVSEKSSATPTPVPAAAGGLSTAAKAGLAVGVAVGVFALAGVVAVFILIRRRNARLAAAESESMAERLSKHGSVKSGSTCHQCQSCQRTEEWQQHDYVSPMSAETGGAYLEWPVGMREASETQESRDIYELGGGGGKFGFEMLGEGHYRELGDELTIQDWESHTSDGMKAKSSKRKK